MTSEEIAAEWKKDTQIDMTELGAESIKIPQLHSKYLNYLMSSQREEKQLRYDLSIVQKLRTEYYMGILDKKTLDMNGWLPFLKKILRTDLPTYLESDEKIQPYRDEYDACVRRTKQIEEIIKAINGRGFLIKNAVDWLRFQNGGF